MPPNPPHAPDGNPKSTRPSSHVQTLLDALRLLFRNATHHGFCPVAAAAYAAQQQSAHPTHALPPDQFKMGAHIGDGSRASHLCSCVANANTSSSSHRDRRRRHQSPQSPPAHTTTETTATEPNQSPPQINDLRKEMQNLDDASKMALVRDRMMSRYKRSKTLELENNVRRLFEDQYKRTTRSGAVIAPPSHSPTDTTAPANPDDMLGCRHYARRCKLKAKCCDLYVTCRFCHDEAMSEDHEMNRFATEKVLCMICMTEQDVTPRCAHCGIEFAHYFCKECRFYENTPGKKVYHCSRCQICRLGEGLDIDNFHCDNCDACVYLPSKPYHRCMSKALHSNCPVCRGYLFTSTEPVVFMRCGHTMHSKCFDDYTAGSYQCPLCMRSLTDMEKYFEQIDELVNAEPMPEEYASKRSLIFCSDCQTKSTVKYHFLYHKCADPDCRSYNTKILEFFDAEDALADNKDACEQERQGQEQHSTTTDLPTSTRREEQGAASSTATLSIPESLESSAYYSSDRRGPLPAMYVEGGDELAPTDDGQFTQPIESTV